MAYQNYVNYGSQILQINNQFVSGVTNVGIETNFNLSPIYVAGIGALQGLSSREIVPSISIEQVFTNFDNIFSTIQNNQLINGLFQYNNNLLSFQSGACSSYSLSCRVGDFVRTSTSFNIYGEFIYTTGSIPSVNTSDITGLNVADYSSIGISLNEATYDRVTAFSCGITFNNVGVFGMGNLHANDIKLKLPVEIKTTFTIEVDQSELYPISSTICSKYSQDVSINIDTRCSDANILTLNLSGAQLSSQRFNGTIGNFASITYEYISYANSLPILT